MSYFREFRLNWTNLLGAGLGLGFGSAFNHYMMNLFGPALIAEFGWSRAQFALVGAIGLIGMVFTPIAGRIADVLCPRKAAAIGFSVPQAVERALQNVGGGHLVDEHRAALARGVGLDQGARHGGGRESSLLL